jgi:GT2 family glycosyltransferase
LGAALAIRRQAFEAVGGFDGSFFMYFEEVDLCYRLNKSGWQTHFAPEASVTHTGAASTKQNRKGMAIQLYKSLCHFYQLHYSRRQSFQLKLVLTYLMLRNIVLDTFDLSQKSDPETNDLTDDLLVWRSVLSSLWSTNGWLR